ncbi:DNA polymerase III subunit delta' [Legionella cardiaca]|uniref:DNA polymerase III subunit delta' n=1 Tax=Legionella cardiaca TaxID=1071983 RepID=A0ABY8AWX2_9GAMM|nr:DNA polymerase III subunit delta' [Legionella cardiaca]WED44221.1 DNA polymerase III subunit delta' [Legionella cardiaca]
METTYADWWEQFSTINRRQRFPHALLLIGSQHAGIIDFSYKMATALLCAQEEKPCGECKSCRLMRSKEHPDLYYLQPEKAGGIIKIDQIRELQTVVYNSPQLGDKRLIIIHPAEKMNAAAANALLKLLEEPPECVIFVLIVEQLSTVLPTILSRCQQWHLSRTESLPVDYLAIGECYTPESERGKIFSELHTILGDLQNLVSQKISVCGLAAKWAAYELNDLIWLMYLINSQMLYYHLIGLSEEKSSTKPLQHLSKYFKPPQLFHQIDELNSIIRKLNQNTSINQLLVLENLLLGYCAIN